MKDRLLEVKEQIQEVADFDPAGMTLRTAFLACEKQDVIVYWGFWTEHELNQIL